MLKNAIKTLLDAQVCEPQLKVVKKISIGLTNTSYLVDDGIRRWVLRINYPGASRLGICRITENTILSAISGRRFAPVVDFSNHDILLTRFIEGRLWGKRDFRSSPQRLRLQALIDEIQSIKLCLNEFYYSEHLQNYWAIYKIRNPKEANKKHFAFTRFLKKLQKHEKPENWVLCHHDLVPENIIENSEGIKILDWEYAKLGFKEFDRASINRFKSGCGRKSLMLELQSWLNELWWGVR